MTGVGDTHATARSERRALSTARVSQSVDCAVVNFGASRAPVSLGTPSHPHTRSRSLLSPRCRAQGRAVSTRHSVAKVCAMIYKWEQTSNVRVTLIAHGEPVCSTRDIQNSPSVRDGGRATPSGRTRGSYVSYYNLLWECNENQILMCQVSIAYCCYVRSQKATSKNYKVMQMSSERFYTRGNQKTIHNFNKL